MRYWVLVAWVTAIGCGESQSAHRSLAGPEIDVSVVSEIVRVGSVAGDSSELLYAPRRPVFISDSLVSVSNALTEIRVYSLDGSLRRTIGRPGDGPAEFRAAFWHDYYNDSLVVVDEQARAIVFDPGGQPIRQVTLGSPA